MSKNLTERALEIVKDDEFLWTVAHPQVYDWEVHHGYYHGPYAKWAWEEAYHQARMERAVDNGLATWGHYGSEYTGPWNGRPPKPDYSDDLPPGVGIFY